MWESKENFVCSESGSSLLGLVAALPAVSLLMLALGATFVFGLRAYAMLLSDWELQDQVRIPMERLVMDLETAEKAEVSGNTLRIYTYTTAAAPKWIEYNLTNESKPRLMRQSQPMTGGSKLGDVYIKSFAFEVENEKLVSFRLEAKNMLTGKEFSLQSAVCLPGKGTGQ